MRDAAMQAFIECAKPHAPPPLSSNPGTSRPFRAGKLAGLDKKLSKSLDAEVQSGSSPLELSMSPVGPLSESSR